MASDVSPICFRVTADERNLLDAVAYYQGETLSAFVRNAVIDFAREVLDKEGREAVLATFKDVEARRASKAAERLQHLERAFQTDELLAEDPPSRRR